MKTKLLSILIVFFTLTSNAQTYMYGTTSEGGANGLGTIYRVDENGQNFQNVFDFSTSTGGTPYSGLTLGGNGKLYGFTTTDGQIINPGASLAMGSFYEFDPLTANFTIIESIDDKSLIGNTFNNSPTKGSGDELYFISENLELAGQQSVLSSYNTNTNTITIIDTLSTLNWVRSKLLFASDNNLYATTHSGGTGSGSIVQFDLSNNTLNVIHISPGTSAGSNGYKLARNNQLFEASNGVLYGASKKGGLSLENGNVFKINMDGTGYQNLISYTSGLSNEGFWPEGSFYEKNGKIYFTTPEEDIVNINAGVIYSIDINTNSVTSEHTLDDATEGARPRGGFTESPNGRLYFTCNGGTLNSGSFLEYNVLTGAVTKTHTFSSADGTKPQHDELAFVDFSLIIDSEDPIAICQNITVQLNNNGIVVINANSIDGGSTDNIGIVSYTAAPNTFNCNDLGTNIVTLIVADAAGNTDSCTAIITVVDNLDPNVIGQNATGDLNGSGSVTIPVSSVDIGSTDNCSIANLTLTPNTFTSVGTYTAVLEGTDPSGNSDDVSVVITIIDGILNITEPEFTDFSMYPNPANTTITIDGGENNSFAILEIFSLTGKKIIHKKITQPSQNISFDISDLASSLYFLSITDSNGKKVMKKLIKE